MVKSLEETLMTRKWREIDEMSADFVSVTRAWSIESNQWFKDVMCHLVSVVAMDYDNHEHLT